MISNRVPFRLTPNYIIVVHESAFSRWLVLSISSIYVSHLSQIFLPWQKSTDPNFLETYIKNFKDQVLLLFLDWRAFHRIFSFSVLSTYVFSHSEIFHKPSFTFNEDFDFLTLHLARNVCISFLTTSSMCALRETCHYRNNPYGKKYRLW